MPKTEGLLAGPLPVSSHPRTVAVVGLGRSGRAVAAGFVRVRTNYRVVGHDVEPERVKAALRVKAIDEGRWNLIDAVTGADLIVLAEPLDALLSSLAAIAPHLADGCLVTDTAGLKLPVLEAAQSLLPAGISFVGGHPLLSAAPADGIADLAGATYCLVPSPGASEAAVKAMAGWVEAVGAQPFYIGAAEHDALVAGVVGLPELLAAVALNVMELSPSARDLWRLAGPSLGALVTAVDRDGAQVRGELLHNRAAALTWLDQALVTLTELRQCVAEGDEGALDRLWATARAGCDHIERPVLVPDYEREAQAELRDYNPLRDLFSFGRRRRQRR